MVLFTHSWKKVVRIWCDWSKSNCQSQPTFLLDTWGQQLSRLVQIIVLSVFWCVPAMIATWLPNIFHISYHQLHWGCMIFSNRKIKDPMEAAQEVAQRSLERFSLSHSPLMAVAFPPASACHPTKVSQHDVKNLPLQCRQRCNMTCVTTWQLSRLPCSAFFGQISEVLQVAVSERYWKHRTQNAFRCYAANYTSCWTASSFKIL